MIAWLGDDACSERSSVGAKAANLSRLCAIHRVPPGFALPAEATAQIVAGEVPPALALSLGAAYEELCNRRSEPESAVAVRSSAIDEDGLLASFAGQHETYLNIRGVPSLLDAVVRCARSARSPEALAYRARHGLNLDRLDIAVLVQSLIRSDVAGVAFSINPMNGNPHEVLINACWGLGESVVGGTVTPDMFRVHKHDWATLSADIGQKSRMTVLETTGTREVPVPRLLQNASSLESSQVVEVAKLVTALEETMGWPADIEFAFHGGELYLLQCRPVTQRSTAEPGLAGFPTRA